MKLVLGHVAPPMIEPRTGDGRYWTIVSVLTVAARVLIDTFV
jgi:hypothetical protein